MTTYLAPLRYNRGLRQALFATLLFFILLLLTGCGPNVDTNPTPVRLFPTAIPSGPPPPTFISFDVTVTPGGPARPSPTSLPRATPLPQPTAIPTLDSNWSSINAGVEYRNLSFRDSRNQTIGVLVARIDPSRATFKVKYAPGQTKTINDWAFSLSGASLIVNGNYFDQSRNPLGLVAVDGTLFGALNRRNDSGLFQVNANNAKVRFLYLEPFNNGERFDQVVQGFPVMVAGGQVAPAFNPDLSKGADRRTVIAQDTHGRILIIVTPINGVTFTDMARWLGVSGLEIDTALNLDGGTSTCMYLQTGGPSQFTPGLTPVPVVLAVYPR